MKLIDWAQIWLLGVVIGNALMDTMCAMLLSSKKPTLYGVSMAFLHAQQLQLPNRYKKANTYFAIVLSWLTAAVAFLAIIIIFIVKSANNSKGKTQQQ